MTPLLLSMRLIRLAGSGRGGLDRRKVGPGACCGRRSARQQVHVAAPCCPRQDRLPLLAASTMPLTLRGTPSDPTVLGCGATAKAEDGHGEGEAADRFNAFRSLCQIEDGCTNGHNSRALNNRNAVNSSSARHLIPSKPTRSAAAAQSSMDALRNLLPAGMGGGNQSSQQQQPGLLADWQSCECKRGKGGNASERRKQQRGHGAVLLSPARPSPLSPLPPQRPPARPS